MKGKHHSEEAKKKMSKAKKGRNKGTYWFNNGTVCFRAKECPEGFKPGMLTRK